jgi:hypothetical protein
VKRLLFGGLGLALLVAAGPDVAGDTDRPAPTAPLVTPIPPIPPGPPPFGVIPPDVRDAAIASRTLPLADRIEAVSAPMIGRPYALDPLGEGEGPDPDPLARYDVFDCLTFVEEVLALAYSGDPVHSAAVRNRIRYGDGPADYLHRRHLMELQWIPGNVADGFLVETTSRYGATTRLEKDVTVETWAKWRRRKLFQLADEQLPVGHMALDVLPLDAALAAVDALPEGALVLTVRGEMGIPMWTTHIGFVVRKDGVTKMRNASRRSAMRVLDENLVWYLEHLKSYDRRPVAGIAVLEPVEQDPRRADVASAGPSARLTGGPSSSGP